MQFACRWQYYNSLTGHIPQGIGRNLLTLGVLSLQSNNFHGSLPTSLCHLSHRQILDLAFNSIFGSIPRCICNLAAIRTSKNMLSSIFSQDSENFYSYNDVEWVMWKRKEQSLRNFLGEVKSIDISNNELSGQIPDGITSLHGLVFLNLLRNNLSGNIASKIENCEIPTGTQLQGFDASAYAGNPRLCGPPFPSCPQHQVSTSTSPLNRENAA